MTSFTTMGQAARHQASERRRAAFVEWVDCRGGKDMLLALKAHRHTLEEVAALTGFPINVVLTVGMEHYGVRMSRARDLGQPRSLASKEVWRKKRLSEPPRAPRPEAPRAKAPKVAATKAEHHRTRQVPPSFFAQAVLEAARLCPDLEPEQVVNGVLRLLRSEAVSHEDRGYDR